MPNENVKNIMKENTVVRISEDALNVIINLCPPLDGQEYSIQDIKEILNQNKVVEGFLDQDILDIIDKKKYYTDVVVAKGEPAYNGEDGYFEYMYREITDNKPKILPDGSVDYSSFQEVKVVEIGDEIAKYIPATMGRNGMSVKGAVLIAKNGKEMRPLTGKGFILSEDKCIYTAAIKGKVEYGGNRITVSNLLVIQNEVNHATGNVSFAGDIFIKSNIMAGMTVRALGNITVEGAVEAAVLIAGKDIVLKNGMQGGQKGIAIAGGNLSGKFFEQVNIKAKGDFNANSVLNCEVEAEGEINVSGKFGVIVGGNIKAIRGIKATMIGNINEMKTSVSAGVVTNIYAELLAIEKNIKTITESVDKVDQAVDQTLEYLAKYDNEEINRKKNQLLRTKIEYSTHLALELKKKDELLDLMDKTANSKIVVNRSLFPGVSVNINGTIMRVEQECYNVTFKLKGVDIEILSNI